MKSKALLATLVVAAFAAGATAAKADYITNGGFETGTLTGSWTVVGNDTGVAPSGFDSLTAHSGADFLALGNFSSTPFGAVAQAVSDTSGQNLTLSYFLASDGNTPNLFQAMWNGTVLSGSAINNASAMSYTQYQFTVTGTGTDVLAFDDYNINGYFALDDVTLNPAQTPVPEPASITLIGLALTSLAFARKRRR